MTSKPDIKSMSADERLALIEEIWGTLTPDDVGLTDAQHDELARRIEDLDKNPDHSIPWSEARRLIRERER